MSEAGSRALVFRHVPHEHLGLIAGALAGRGIQYEYVDFFADPHRQPDLDGVDALIVLGGPMNVDETDRYPFLAAEVAAIRSMIERNRPVLGICLGSQLIAKALGVSVYKNPVAEIGWLPVRLTSAGEADPLLGNLDPEETVLEWHGDAFPLPPGTVHLAETDACPRQAFRSGDNVYGLLFHLEVDADELAGWLADPGMRAEAEAAGTLASIERDAPRYLDRLAAVAPAVFDTFADLVRPAEPAQARQLRPDT